MLNSFPIILIIGTVLGFLSGLGIGGGSLLIVWLTTVLEMDPQIARSINLQFFIPSTVVACLFRMKDRELHLKPLLPAIIAGCLSAAICSSLALKINAATLQKGFAILLLAAGTKELFYRDRKAR